MSGNPVWEQTGLGFQTSTGWACKQKYPIPGREG